MQNAQLLTGATVQPAYLKAHHQRCILGVCEDGGKVHTDGGRLVGQRTPAATRVDYPAIYTNHEDAAPLVGLQVGQAERAGGLLGACSRVKEM